MLSSSTSSDLACTDDFLHNFGVRLAQRIAPAAPFNTVSAAITQTISEARAANPHVLQNSLPSQPARRVELVFVHSCRNNGCNSAQCVLCKHNPNKRCTGNFASKYWVGDRLLAKCEGGIQVEVLDLDTGDRVDENLSGARLQVCILDGNKYSAMCREAGGQQMRILSECEVLLNQKGEPLLVAGSAMNTSESAYVTLKFQEGTSAVALRDLKVTESSESVLSGTKRPPFRLLCRATQANGTNLNVQPAVSEEFVVVTKRTKNLKKQEIPFLDDPISKLNHIGKETVKKLNELKVSADEASFQLDIPPELYRVTKVKEFQILARMSENDGHMQQKLKQLLKLSKEKWDSACEHSKTAVQADNRIRAWYMNDMRVGLLYSCRLGDIRPDSPLALVLNGQHDGSDVLEVLPLEHLVPGQRDQVTMACDKAMAAWWEDSHPGWMIFTLGQTQFESLEEINRFSESGEQPAPMQMQYSASLEVGMASADEAETSGRELPEAGGFERSSSGSQRAGEDRRPQSRHQRGSPEGSHRLTERHEERHLDQQGRLHTALAGRQLQQMPFPIPRMGGQQGMGMMQPLMESGGWRGSHGGEPGDRHDDMEEEPGSPVNPFAGIAAKPFATENNTRGRASGPAEVGLPGAYSGLPSSPSLGFGFSGMPSRGGASGGEWTAGLPPIGMQSWGMNSMDQGLAQGYMGPQGSIGAQGSMGGFGFLGMDLKAMGSNATRRMPIHLESTTGNLSAESNVEVDGFQGEQGVETGPADKRKRLREMMMGEHRP